MDDRRENVAGSGRDSRSLHRTFRNAGCAGWGATLTKRKSNNEKRRMSGDAAVRLVCAFSIRYSFSYSFLVLPFRYLRKSSVFRATTDLVVVPVTVTDRLGRFVSGLTADQFELKDAGEQRAITQFTTERVPVSLAILLDISASMATDAKARAEDDARWADTRRALELLVERLDPRDEVLFAAFADKVGLAVPWTRDHQQVTRAFNALRPGGFTAMFDAVKLISPAFQRAEHGRKVLLVITDGRDSLVPHIRGTPPVQPYGLHARAASAVGNLLPPEGAARLRRRRDATSGDELWCRGLCDRDGNRQGRVCGSAEPGDHHRQFGRLCRGDQRAIRDYGRRLPGCSTSCSRNTCSPSSRRMLTATTTRFP